MYWHSISKIVMQSAFLDNSYSTVPNNRLSIINVRFMYRLHQEEHYISCARTLCLPKSMALGIDQFQKNSRNLLSLIIFPTYPMLYPCVSTLAFDNP